MFDKYIAPHKIFFHPDRIKAFLEDGIVQPISVKLRLTDKCNSKCFYCSYKDDLNNGEIAIENLLIVFKRLKLMGVKSIVFTGGEPTCYSMFEEAIKISKEMHGFDIGLITNGVMSPAKIAKYLTWVRFSLDTIDKTAYRESRGIDAVGKVLTNINDTILIRDSIAPWLTVGIQAVLNNYNFDYMFKSIINVVEYAAKIKADYFQIRPLENVEYTEEQLLIINGLLKSLKETNYGIKMLFTDYKWNEIKNGYYKNYNSCPSADFIGSVDVKGDFYMCCANINDSTAKYGNLITDNVADILGNRKEIQDKFDYNKCTLICQGSLLNQTLNELKNIKHKNFI